MLFSHPGSVLIFYLLALHIAAHNYKNKHEKIRIAKKIN
jgi:hypothetical protein